MAKARQIRSRLAAVRKVRAVTTAMETVATSRFKKAHRLAVDARAYTGQLTGMVDDIVRRTPPKRRMHPLFRVPKNTRREVLLVLTSQRGLCGGYNQQILALATERHAQLVEAGYEVSLHVTGRKGLQFLHFRRFEVEREYTDLAYLPDYATVARLADEMMEWFVDGRISGLEVAYMQLLSPGRQKPAIAPLLPVSSAEPPSLEEGEEPIPYEFLPSTVEVFEKLLPATVRLRLYQCFLDAAVGEQIARISAMRGANENANEMIRTLALRYNRMRQAQITTELAEILAGRSELE
jgi:F-type H+-transporting ATPase subunit gamma